MVLRSLTLPFRVRARPHPDKPRLPGPPFSEEPSMPGRIVGIDLHDAQSARAAADFYSHVFGWPTNVVAEGQVWVGAAGGARIDQDVFQKVGSTPWLLRLMVSERALQVLMQRVMVVVEVPDLRETMKLATLHGGTVADAPFTHPSRGLCCHVADPDGFLTCVVEAPNPVVSSPDPSGPLAEFPDPRGS